MIYNGWIADYPDPDNFLRVNRQYGLWSIWRNDAYEALLKKAKEALNQKVRMTCYREADRVLMEEAVVMPLTYGRRRMLVKPWVRRFSVDERQWKNIVLESH
ncbi:MAG: hypothetical protein ACK2UK_20670 [Candidatus Promineifilaceae bacterium]